MDFSMLGLGLGESRLVVMTPEMQKSIQNAPDDSSPDEPMSDDLEEKEKTLTMKTLHNRLQVLEAELQAKNAIIARRKETLAALRIPPQGRYMPEFEVSKEIPVTLRIGPQGRSAPEPEGNKEIAASLIAPESRAAPEPEINEEMEAVISRKAPHPLWFGGLRPPYIPNQEVYAQQFLNDLAEVRDHAGLFKIHRKYALSTYRPNMHIQRLACCGLEMMPSRDLLVADPIDGRFDTLENCHVFLSALLSAPIDASSNFMLFALHGKTSGRFAIYEKNSENKYEMPPWRFFTYSRHYEGAGNEKKTK